MNDVRIIIEKNKILLKNNVFAKIVKENCYHRNYIRINNEIKSIIDFILKNEVSIERILEILKGDDIVSLYLNNRDDRYSDINVKMVKIIFECIKELMENSLKNNISNDNINNEDEYKKKQEEIKDKEKPNMNIKYTPFIGCHGYYDDEKEVDIVSGDKIIKSIQNQIKEQEIVVGDKVEYVDKLGKFYNKCVISKILKDSIQLLDEHVEEYSLSFNDILIITKYYDPIGEISDDEDDYDMLSPNETLELPSYLRSEEIYKESRNKFLNVILTHMENQENSNSTPKFTKMLEDARKEVKREMWQYKSDSNSFKYYKHLSDTIKILINDYYIALPYFSPDDKINQNKDFYNKVALAGIELDGDIVDIKLNDGSCLNKVVCKDQNEKYLDVVFIYSETPLKIPKENIVMISRSNNYKIDKFSNFKSGDVVDIITIKHEIGGVSIIDVNYDSLVIDRLTSNGIFVNTIKKSDILNIRFSYNIIKRNNIKVSDLVNIGIKGDKNKIQYLGVIISEITDNDITVIRPPQITYASILKISINDIEYISKSSLITNSENNSERWDKVIEHNNELNTELEDMKEDNNSYKIREQIQSLKYGDMVAILLKDNTQLQRYIFSSANAYCISVFPWSIFVDAEENKIFIDINDIESITKM